MSSAKCFKIFLCSSTFLALQEQLVVSVSTFVLVSRVWSVSCLLFFYLWCPSCLAICKSWGGGHMPSLCLMESAPLPVHSPTNAQRIHICKQKCADTFLNFVYHCINFSGNKKLCDTLYCSSFVSCAI